MEVVTVIWLRKSGYFHSVCPVSGLRCSDGSVCLIHPVQVPVKWVLLSPLAEGEMTCLFK